MESASAEKAWEDTERIELDICPDKLSLETKPSVLGRSLDQLRTENDWTATTDDGSWDVAASVENTLWWEGLERTDARNASSSSAPEMYAHILTLFSSMLLVSG